MTRRVRVTMNGRTVEGECVLASENKESLGIMLEDVLRTSDGGMYCSGALPLLWNEDRERYEDLRGEPVEVRWL